jgi:molecular chaperone DnaK
MVKDAEAHAEEDRRRREEAEVRNNGDTLVYQTEKVLREQGEKVSGSEKEAVESALAELKEALAGDDIDRIRRSTDALMTASQTFSARLYEAASQSGGDGAGDGTGAGDGAGSSDDEVVDAEIVDEDQDRSA